ncbi:MAG: NAD-glutamate dehydrogenase domain-containing protein, partial [Sphingomicrobium sp.]
MTAHSRLAKPLVEALRAALTQNALPGETHGFSKDQQVEAATFVAECAAVREPGTSIVRLESIGGEAGNRRMRLVTVNEDMPFLVDSVAAAVFASGIEIQRLLHPIVAIERTTDGAIRKVGRGTAESIVYMELRRVDARGRQALLRAVETALRDVCAAVGDWANMVALMAEDADALDADDSEGAELLRWFTKDNFTLLGHINLTKNGGTSKPLGIFRNDFTLWDQDTPITALRTLAKGKHKLLNLKATRLSSVHRRVPLDVVMVHRKGGSISLHAGLWTSVAMRAPADEVPILRERLAALDRELGFAPSSHGGKALSHAISTLPHDLLIGFDAREVRTAALTAMSLVDRPRPRLLLLPDALRLHVYAFAWLPRDEYTTARRKAVAATLERAIDSKLSNWSVELDEGELALLRFTLPMVPNTELPDPEALDRAIMEMVRGWAPSVEGELIALVGSARATRLSLTYLPAFPDAYRLRTGGLEAASDVLQLCGLRSERDRSVRMWRTQPDQGDTLHLKAYARGGLVPLSEVVPVLENFGFRVLEEVPTALADGTLGYIHDFRLELGSVGDLDAIMARSEEIEAAIGSVLSGASENDEFNQLVLFAALSTQAVVWIRAWFRYLRQTGSSFGLVTIVDALRRAPKATSALIRLFSATHDPAGSSQRQKAVERIGREFDDALATVTSIDEDRILRRLRVLVDAIIRTNAFAPAAAEALAFKIDSSRVPGLPAPVPWREIWVYSPRVEGIHLRGGPVARGGIRWSDRRDDFRTEILGLMKAQLVKNAVIVPTGAKGGFYPKQLPSPNNRDVWLAE